MKRPTEPAHRITTVEGARKQHVLCADQDAFALRPRVPLVRHVASHQDVNPKSLFESESFDRGTGDVARLLDQRPHRQAVDQSSPNAAWILQAPPHPRAEYGVGLTRSGRRVDER